MSKGKDTVYRKGKQVSLLRPISNSETARCLAKIDDGHEHAEGVGVRPGIRRREHAEGVGVILCWREGGLTPLLGATLQSHHMGLAPPP